MEHMKTDNKWIAAYYPSELIEDQDQRLKSILCLLYDKVIIHFPIAHTGCGGGMGISGEFFPDCDPLVEEGVLEAREEFFLDEIEADFSPGHPWGTHEEFNRYYELNITGMALVSSEKEGAVPVTGKSRMPLPISVLQSLDLSRSVGIQAGALAIQSLELALPSFANLKSEDVLEAREKLKNELIPFRAAMLALAPKVRTGITANADMAELQAEARYVAETDVLPRLIELQHRLKLEHGNFWRKLIQKAGSRLPTIALKWASTSGVSAAVDAARLAGDTTARIIDNERLQHQLLTNGGLGYLVNLQAQVQKKAAA